MITQNSAFRNSVILNN